MDSGSGHLLVTWWLVFWPDSWLVDWAITVLRISPPNPHFSLSFPPLFPSPSLASYHHPSLSLPSRFPSLPTHLSLPLSVPSHPRPPLSVSVCLSLSPVNTTCSLNKFRTVTPTTSSDLTQSTYSPTETADQMEDRVNWKRLHCSNYVIMRCEWGSMSLFWKTVRAPPPLFPGARSLHDPCSV